MDATDTRGEPVIVAPWKNARVAPGGLWLNFYFCFEKGFNLRNSEFLLDPYGLPTASKPPMPPFIGRPLAGLITGGLIAGGLGGLGVGSLGNLSNIPIEISCGPVCAATSNRLIVAPRFLSRHWDLGSTQFVYALTPPRAQHPIRRDCGRRTLARLNQFSPYQPAYSRLCRAFRYAHRIRHGLVAGRNSFAAASGRFKREPKINQETGRLTVMAHQVPHQNIHHIVIDRHRTIPSDTIAGFT